jgi:hypothetical protein
VSSIVLLKDGEPTKCLASGNPQSTSPFPAFQTASNAYTSGEPECFTVCLTMESDGHAMLGKEDSVRDFSAAWRALSMIFKSRTFPFSLFVVLFFFLTFHRESRIIVHELALHPHRGC